MNSQESTLAQPELHKTCMSCNQPGSTDNPIKSPLGEGWDICLQCYSKEAEQMLKFKQLRTRYYPEIDKVAEGIYLSNEDAACDFEIVQKFNIRAICVCGNFLDTPFINQKLPGPISDIKYIVYKIDDSVREKILHLFDSNCEWVDAMRAEGRNVLIHCAAGVSRSASFTIAYMMKKYQMDYKTALDYVKEKRPIIFPNSAFREQLKEYEQILGKTRSISQQAWKAQSQTE